ncbi:MAG: ATP-binding protein [Acetivibrio ethanolgignens]
MAQFISYFLYGMGVNTFFISVIVFRKRKSVPAIGNWLALFSFASTIWSNGFCMVFIQEDPWIAYLWRCMGMIGMFVYLVSGVHLVIAWSGLQNWTIRLIQKISYFAVILCPFLLLPGNVEFKKTSIGMSYTFLPGLWNNLYNIYCVLIAVSMVGAAAYIWKAGKKRRDRVMGGRLLLAEIIIVIGMVMDTILPMFGVEAFPGSTISQALGVFAFYGIYSSYRRNLVNIENMSQFVYYSVETPVLVYDDKRELKLANKSAKEFLKFPDDDKKVPLKELFFFDEDAYLANPQEKQKLDAKCRVNDRNCRLGINPVIDKYKDIIGYVVMIEDFTDIAEAKQRADDANRAKSIFLANMSHEIRTPLNAILGMDELILREKPEGCIEEYAVSIKRAGNTLLGIISDILDLSKIESGKMTLSEEKYSTAQMLQDVIYILTYKIEEKGLKFETEIQEDVPELLYGDELRMKQIVTNLLNNAVKYTSKGKITLCLSWEQKDHETIWMEFKVKDTGSGIRKEDIERIFTSFERLEEDKNKGIEGSGLGLSITQNLTELMGGSLYVESKYGEGTVFTVRLPQRIASYRPMGTLEMEGISRTYIKENSFIAPEARILIVDDTLVTLRIIRELLKRTEIKSDLATNGQDALNMVKKKSYNMIFLDHVMPQMDGIETLKRIQQITDGPNVGIPVIALTANAVIGSREFYLKSGFTDYLAKPVDGEKLENMIEKYLPQQLVQKIEK